MQVLAFIECFPAASVRLLPAGAGVLSPAVSLPFNPIKLLCLVGWVYLCLYCVQRVQFGLLVSKNHKSVANIAALLAGPIFIFVMLMVDVIRKSSESNFSIFEIIREKIQSVSVSNFRARDDSAIRLLDSSGTDLKEIYGHGRSRSQDKNILDYTEQIIWDALKERASDILIDPKDESIYTVRFRVDGVLRTVEQIEADTCQAVVNSIKAVSNMDIAEKRRPQDGAFIAKTADGIASFRVASAGVINGEKLSIRVLCQDAGMFTLNNVGLPEKQRTIIKAAIAKPSGMILMCGPTGSGKTTTLYAMLNEIDLFTRNVITVEDPIEYVLPNASQIEVNPKADITFAKTLRSILRQDPDVICVGEIRDEETAGTALRAAQTGHLVLATIHSESNASALIRLLDLGVTPLDCKVPAEISKSQMYDFRRRGINHRKMFQSNGCERCHETGYYGRTAIFDILVLDNKLKASIANNELSIVQLRTEGDKRGKSNLQKQGLKKVVSGITSLEELKRVVG